MLYYTWRLKFNISNSCSIVIVAASKYSQWGAICTLHHQYLNHVRSLIIQVLLNSSQGTSLMWTDQEYLGLTVIVYPHWLLPIILSRVELESGPVYNKKSFHRICSLCIISCMSKANAIPVTHVSSINVSILYIVSITGCLYRTFLKYMVEL